MSTPAPPVSLRESAGARRGLRAALARWFAVAGRDLPWRRTHDPYAILVSEMMLQQTQVATVGPYFTRWLARFPTVQALAEAPEAEVLSVWQGLGYYARARNLHRAAQWVVAEGGGAMPADLAGLRALPGAGRYTAGAIASFAYDQPAAAVDANIGRVLARLFGLREPIDTTRGREALWAAAELLLPARGGRGHNSALMELGALLCVSRRPLCALCPARRWCATQSDVLPVKSARKATVALAEDCAWLWHRGRVLLEQQEGPRWTGLWKLPRRAEPAPGSPLWKAVYPFTHHRVTLQVFRETPREPRAREAWFDEAEWQRAALAAPHRRAVAGLWAREQIF